VAHELKGEVIAMSTAVIFYSASGNCAIAGKALAEKLSACLIELKERKTKDMSRVNAAFIFAGMRASLGMRSRLMGQPWRNAAEADELHIIFPIWASKPVPAVNTFVARCDFNGKRVALYAVQADPSDTAKPCRDKLAAGITARGGGIIGSYHLVGSAPGKEPRAELAQEIQGL
jgi:hypothetical protein